MTRQQLEHAIRAACEVAEDRELIIFGSQAILGQFPDAPPELRASIEVDVQPRNYPEKIDLIDGTLGELSQFHQTHGFYVHGVSVKAAKLPVGWENRMVKVQHADYTNDNIGYCVEIHDLAASKLYAFREKDRDFVWLLLAESLISADVLQKRIKKLQIDLNESKRLLNWVKITREDL